MISARDVKAQSNFTPDSALSELLVGNKRFAANQLTSIEHDLVISEAIKAGELKVEAGVYDLGTGKVRLLSA